MYKVYIKTDSENRITEITSNEFLSATTGYTEIDEGEGDKYHHAQNNYLEKPISDDNGVFNYKLENGAAVLRTEAEKAADVPAPAPILPTEMETVQAQITYTAMMTDTLLEG